MIGKRKIIDMTISHYLVHCLVQWLPVERLLRRRDVLDPSVSLRHTYRWRNQVRQGCLQDRRYNLLIRSFLSCSVRPLMLIKHEPRLFESVERTPGISRVMRGSPEPSPELKPL
jgi:hypothetical protein